MSVWKRVDKSDHKSFSLIDVFSDLMENLSPSISKFPETRENILRTCHSCAMSKAFRPTNKPSQS